MLRCTIKKQNSEAIASSSRFGPTSGQNRRLRFINIHNFPSTDTTEHCDRDKTQISSYLTADYKRTFLSTMTPRFKVSKHELIEQFGAFTVHSPYLPNEVAVTCEGNKRNLRNKAVLLRRGRSLENFPGILQNLKKITNSNRISLSNINLSVFLI